MFHEQTPVVKMKGLTVDKHKKQENFFPETTDKYSVACLEKMLERAIAMNDDLVGIFNAGNQKAQIFIMFSVAVLTAIASAFAAGVFSNILLPLSIILPYVMVIVLSLCVLLPENSIRKGNEPIKIFNSYFEELDKENNDTQYTKILGYLLYGEQQMTSGFEPLLIKRSMLLKIIIFILATSPFTSLTIFYTSFYLINSL